MKAHILFILFQLPMLLFAQKGAWSVHSDLGLNISFNRMTTIIGTRDYMLNKKMLSGSWGLGVKYQFSEKNLLSLGFDHVAYSYHYSYQHDNGAGAGAQSSVFIWGFPIGIEHIWLQNDCIQFTTGYGLKYRINRLGSPFAYASYKEQYNRNDQLIFSQNIKEYDFTQTNHLFALFTYAQFNFKLSKKVQLGFQLSYNQGLNKHESFKFEAINRLPLEDAISIDQYQYSSKASYLGFGLKLNYMFLKKEKSIIHFEKETGL
jgi:hypothetical protein